MLFLGVDKKKKKKRTKQKNWITVELHITGARHEEAVAREFWARNHSALERIDIVIGHVRPLRSAVVEDQAPSVA